MADENRDPDIGRFQFVKRPEDRQEAERQDDLRHNRDVEWALGVRGPLQAAGATATSK